MKLAPPLRATAAAGLLILGACAAPDRPAEREDARAPLTVLRDPPDLVAASPAQAASVAEQAAALRAAALGETQGVEALIRARAERRIEPQAAPFLYGSALGRRFLEAQGARAIARGAPEAHCPAGAVGAAGEPRAPTRADFAEAARVALADCHARLRALGAPSDCGCALLAVGEVLTAPLAAFAYAPGVGARLIGAAGLGGRPLVAEQRRADDDPEAVDVALRDALGVVATARLTGDGAARLTLADGARFEGVREPLGWRRGRLVERLLLRGSDGARLIALIGFEPADIAADGPALAVWTGP